VSPGPAPAGELLEQVRDQAPATVQASIMASAGGIVIAEIGIGDPDQPGLAKVFRVSRRGRAERVLAEAARVALEDGPREDVPPDLEGRTVGILKPRDGRP
jgi:hypothetical protein